MCLAACHYRNHLELAAFILLGDANPLSKRRKMVRGQSKKKKKEHPSYHVIWIQREMVKKSLIQVLPDRLRDVR